MAGYSPKTARQQGSRLLTNVDVKEELKKIAKETRSKYGVTKSSLLKALLSILKSSPSDYIFIASSGDVKLRPNVCLKSLASFSLLETEKKKSLRCTFISQVDTIYLLGLLCGYFNPLADNISKNRVQDIIKRLNT